MGCVHLEDGSSESVHDLGVGEGTWPCHYIQYKSQATYPRSCATLVGGMSASECLRVEYERL